MARSGTVTPPIDARLLQERGLAPIRFLGGQRQLHWLVEAEGRTMVLRRYAPERQDDPAYEIAVLERLRRGGWPVPEIIEPPFVHGERTWSLMSYLPGSHTMRTAPEEQRYRGRLLAELHQATASFTDLGQRRGFARSDEALADPRLHEAVEAYARLRPDTGRVLRWHLERARECFAALDPAEADTLVLHGDFTPWNLLFEGDALSGIVDFEAAHLNFRVADFALAWRGRYDDVIRGYEEVSRLTELERQLLVPVFWSWLFLGVADNIERMRRGIHAVHGFDWQVRQMLRRSPLFGALREPYA